MINVYVWFYIIFKKNFLVDLVLGSMAQQVEGTGNNGENEFELWLKNNGVKQKMIKKLIKEMDSVYVLHTIYIYIFNHFNIFNI